jgi:hypothetical protein
MIIENLTFNLWLWAEDAIDFIDSTVDFICDVVYVHD